MRNRILRGVAFVTLVALPFSAGCAALAAAGSALLPAFHRLLGTVAQNYGGEYRDVLQDLVTLLTKETVTRRSGDAKDAKPLALDVSLLRLQRREDGASVPVTIKDGEVLRDGRGDPSQGDRVKVAFRPNRHCHVYVLAIDATGWANVIFPSEHSQAANPVQAEQLIEIPEGTGWYPLDEHRGTENVYFLASVEPRPDIEGVFAKLRGRQRPDVAPSDLASIEEPAIATRGFGDKVVHEGDPARIQNEGGREFEVRPTEFIGNLEGIDLLITRYFEHQ